MSPLVLLVLSVHELVIQPKHYPDNPVDYNPFYFILETINFTFSLWAPKGFQLDLWRLNEG